MTVPLTEQELDDHFERLGIALTWLPGNYRIEAAGRLGMLAGHIDALQAGLVSAQEALRLLSKADLFDGGRCFCDRHFEYEPHSEACLVARAVLAGTAERQEQPVEAGGDRVAVARVELRARDLRIDTFRPAVVNANVAVRITHVPTGLVAECDTYKGELRNREAALHYLTKMVRRYVEAGSAEPPASETPEEFADKILAHGQTPPSAEPPAKPEEETPIDAQERQWHREMDEELYGDDA